MSASRIKELLERREAIAREIARMRPASLDTLRGISGIGARKLQAYGEEIVGLVRGA